MKIDWDKVSHTEIAHLNFDQWILSIGVRVYTQKQNVDGMCLLIFKCCRGFRYLDEGDMIKYSFPEKYPNLWAEIPRNDGWLKQEINFGNIIAADHSKEFFVSGIGSECICVLATDPPDVIIDLDETLLI